MVLLSAVSVDYKGTASDNNPRLSLSSVLNTLAGGGVFKCSQRLL